MNRRPQSFRPWAIPLGIFLALGSAHCDPTARGLVPDSTLLSYAEELLEEGDLMRARDVIVSHHLTEYPRGQLYLAEVELRAGDPDLALRVLKDPVERTAEWVAQLMDTCSHGALAALDEGNPELARTRLAFCAENPRIDIQVLALRASEDKPSEAAVRRLVQNFQSATAAPELDFAAEQAEGLFLAWSEEASDNPVERLRWLSWAFAVGQDEELHARVIGETLAAAEGLIETDRQSAATLFEMLVAPQVPGLDVPQEFRERASRGAREALLPVVIGSLRESYEREAAEQDAAAGRYNLEAGTFVFERLDRPANYEAFLSWMYERFGRPRPAPTPDPLRWNGFCEDRSVPCVIDWDQMGRMVHFLGDVEEDFLKANPELEFSWGEP